MLEHHLKRNLKQNVHSTTTTVGMGKNFLRGNDNERNPPCTQLNQKKSTTKKSLGNWHWRKQDPPCTLHFRQPPQMTELQNQEQGNPD